MAFSCSEHDSRLLQREGKKGILRLFEKVVYLSRTWHTSASGIESWLPRGYTGFPGSIETLAVISCGQLKGSRGVPGLCHMRTSPRAQLHVDHGDSCRHRADSTLITLSRTEIRVLPRQALNGHVFYVHIW